MPRKKRSRPQRAKKGQGSVVPYGKDQWRARLRKAGYPDLFGTVRDTFEEADADRASLSFEEAYADRSRIPTLREFMRDQLEDKLKRKREVAYGTWKYEEITWRRRVWPSDLGKLPIDRITTEHCQAFIDGLTRLAPRRVDGKLIRDDNGNIVYDPTGIPLDRAGLKRIGAAVAVYFAKAKRLKLISSNPMSDVEYPAESRQVRARKNRRKSLTPNQAAGLGANLLKFTTELRSQGSRFEAMVMTQRDTGFRRGELCALKWSQVRSTKEGPFIVVDSGIAAAEGGIQDKETKTGSIRELPISPDTYDRLMAIREQVRDEPARASSPYVFTTKSGKPVTPNNYNRSFRAFREAIGMPQLTPHNLRNTYISIMLRARVDLKTIQKNVGHASPRMIMTIYGETFDESQRESVGRFFDVLKEAEQKGREDQEEQAG